MREEEEEWNVLVAAHISHVRTLIRSSEQRTTWWTVNTFLSDVSGSISPMKESKKGPKQSKKQRRKFAVFSLPIYKYQRAYILYKYKLHFHHHRIYITQINNLFWCLEKTNKIIINLHNVLILKAISVNVERERTQQRRKRWTKDCIGRSYENKEDKTYPSRHHNVKRTRTNYTVISSVNWLTV